jgi:hypothetical protein
MDAGQQQQESLITAGDVESGSEDPQIADATQAAATEAYAALFTHNSATGSSSAVVHGGDVWLGRSIQGVLEQHQSAALQCTERQHLGAHLLVSSDLQQQLRMCLRSLVHPAGSYGVGTANGCSLQASSLYPVASPQLRTVM